MRRRLALVVLAATAGCNGAPLPPETCDRCPGDTPVGAVERYGFAVNHRRSDLYDELMAGAETTNESGACIDWLDPSFWESADSGVCGAPLAHLELTSTDERLRPDSVVEVTASADIRRDTGEDAGVFSSLVIAFTLRPQGEGFRIERVDIRDPWAWAPDGRWRPGKELHHPS